MNTLTVRGLAVCALVSVAACSSESVARPDDGADLGTTSAAITKITTYIDLRLDEKTFEIAYSTGSPGSSNLTIVSAAADPITRTAFSKAAPFVLPCNVTGVLGQINIYYQNAWTVAPPGTFVMPTSVALQPHVWPMMNEALYLDGNPATPIHSNGWNDNAAPYGGINQLSSPLYEMSDSHTIPQTAGFFTVDSNEPNYNFWSLYTPSDLPIDSPFVLHFWITDYTCSSFSQSCLYADKNPTDNAVDVWMKKPACQ